VALIARPFRAEPPASVSGKVYDGAPQVGGEGTAVSKICKSPQEANKGVLDDVSCGVAVSGQKVGKSKCIWSMSGVQVAEPVLAPHLGERPNQPPHDSLRATLHVQYLDVLGRQKVSTGRPNSVWRISTLPTHRGAPWVAAAKREPPIDQQSAKR